MDVLAYMTVGPLHRATSCIPDWDKHQHLAKFQLALSAAAMLNAQSAAISCLTYRMATVAHEQLQAGFQSFVKSECVIKSKPRHHKVEPTKF